LCSHPRRHCLFSLPDTVPSHLPPLSLHDALPISVAGILAHRIAALEPQRLPAPVRRKCEDLLIDVVGLCLTARNEDYVKAALAGWDEEGPCSAIGHARGMSAAGAAFVNGTAAHGED